MTGDEMERAIQFLLQAQAGFFADLEGLKESHQRLAESQQRTDAQIQALTENVEAMRLEMREAMENLIVANEVTRDLAQQIGQLAINTSQRVGRLENRVDTLEQRP
jgi:hypothetical protein